MARVLRVVSVALSAASAAGDFPAPSGLSAGRGGSPGWRAPRVAGAPSSAALRPQGRSTLRQVSAGVASGGRAPWRLSLAAFPGGLRRWRCAFYVWPGEATCRRGQQGRDSGRGGGTVGLTAAREGPRGTGVKGGSKGRTPTPSPYRVVLGPPGPARPSLLRTARGNPYGDAVARSPGVFVLSFKKRKA